MHKSNARWDCEQEVKIGREKSKVKTLKELRKK